MQCLLYSTHYSVHNNEMCVCVCRTFLNFIFSPIQISSCSGVNKSSSPKAFGLSARVQCLRVRTQRLPVTIYVHHEYTRTYDVDRAYLWIIWWSLCQTAARPSYERENDEPLPSITRTVCVRTVSRCSTTSRSVWIKNQLADQ